MDGVGNTQSATSMLTNQAHGIRDDLNDLYSSLEALTSRLQGERPPEPSTGEVATGPEPQLAGQVGEINSVLRDAKRTCINIRRIVGRLNEL